MSYCVNNSTCRAGSAAGQAIIEFVVGLVAVLALVAGLLQVASLSIARTNAMVNARRQAAEQAMSEMEALFSPDFISLLDAGADGKTYTRDDRRGEADTVAFQDSIVHQAGGENWDVIQAVPGNDFSGILDYPLPASALGLVRGRDSRSVELLPGFQKLIYRAPSIDVVGEVWMTHTRGIY